MSILFDKHETDEHTADLERKRKDAGRDKPETEQDREINRVHKGLAVHILAFRLNYSVGDQFTMDDLNSALEKADVSFRPDSPRRILNQLRNSGELGFEVVNRAAGLRKWTK